MLHFRLFQEDIPPQIHRTRSEMVVATLQMVPTTTPHISVTAIAKVTKRASQEIMKEMTNIVAEQVQIFVNTIQLHC